MITFSHNKYTVISAALCIFLCFDSYNVSVVYNMKLSDITRRFQLSDQGEEKNGKGELDMNFTVIDQWRETYNNIRQNSIAGLLTLLYSLDYWYISLASSVGYVKNTFPFQVPFRTSITQVDDLLFSGGYAIEIKDHTRITINGLLGIPVHQDVSLIGAQFGTGHVGFGPQLDVAYAYADDKDHLLLGSVRYIRFLSRCAEACLNEHSEFFKIVLGNTLDVLCSTNQTWGHHNWELGYNGEFSFGGYVEPNLIEITNDQFVFMRSSFYTAYAYSFSIGKYDSGVLFGFSYGSDYRPLPLVYKRLVSGWFSWNINF